MSCIAKVVATVNWSLSSLLHLQKRDTFGLIRRKKHIFLIETCIEPCVTKTPYKPVLLTDCSSASMLTTENIKDKDLIICPTDHDTLAVWTMKCFFLHSCCQCGCFGFHPHKKGNRS